AGDDGPLARRAQVDQQVAAGLVVHQRAGRHTQLEIRAGRTGLLLAASVLASPGAQLLGIGGVEQGRETASDARDASAPVAAIAAAGAAARDVLLAPEGDAAVAPVARLHADLDLVDELHSRADCSGTRPSPPRSRRMPGSMLFWRYADLALGSGDR